MLRSPLKTLLFFALIALVTLFVFLGLSIRFVGESVMARCDENYVTIADFRYYGADYPNETAYDPAMAADLAAFDWAAVANNPNVLRLNRTLTMNALSPDYLPKASDSAFKGYVVAVVKGALPLGSKPGTAFTLSAAYYPLDYRKDSQAAVVLYNGGFDGNTEVFPFEADRTYAVIGTTDKLGAYQTINVHDLPEELFRAAGLPEGSLSPVLDITDVREAFLSNPPSAYTALAAFLQYENTSFHVAVTGDINALLEFHQNQVNGDVQGRFFTTGEYENAAQVCVMTKQAAFVMGVEVGDKIPLTFFAPSALLTTGENPRTKGATADFEIVGLIDPPAEMSGNLYIPGDEAAYPLARTAGYVWGQAVLNNGGAADFLNGIAPALPTRLRVMVYDQGYGVAEKAIGSVLQTGGMISLICLPAYFIVLAVFGLLFAYKQRETADIMLALGTKTGHVRLYLVFGAAILAVVASAAGILLGYLFSDKMTQALFTGAVKPLDGMFSNSTLGIQKEFLALIPGTPVLLAVAAAAASMVCASAFLLLFAQRSITARAARGTKSKRLRIVALGPSKARKSSMLPGGALKYALLSLRRGGVRSAAVFASCLVITAFACGVSAVITQTRDRLDAVYEGTEIQGHFTNTSGSAVTELMVERDVVEALVGTDYVRDAYTVSRSAAYMYLDTPEGSRAFFRDIGSSFAYEAFINETLQWDRAFLTDNLQGAPEFIYSGGEADIRFAAGWDMASFARQTLAEERVCLVSDRFMSTYNLRYGDVIFLGAVVYLSGQTMAERTTCSAVIVGTYNAQGPADNLYMPPAQMFEILHYTMTSSGGRPPVVTEEAIVVESNYSAAGFFLRDARRLDDFKCFLYGEKFSYPGHLTEKRVFLMLDDKDFITSRDLLGRQLAYLTALSLVLYALSVAVSVFLSYLIMSGRKSEFALMKSVGARRGATFLSFVWEQAILCVLSGAAVAAGFAAAGALPGEGLQGAALATACFLAGSAASIAAFNRTSPRALFAAAE
jgi:ABC-type lipoprotein release transport system permease subunit